MASRRLATVDAKITMLKRLRNELQDTPAACDGGRVAEGKVVQALPAHVQAIPPEPTVAEGTARKAMPAQPNVASQWAHGG